MDEWIQVFRTGRHADSAGNVKDWTLADLDRIAAQYNPAQHEAPVVIGHPNENAPAWGWVEALKREREFLYAKMKNLVPEFVDMVKKGLFKKRSISIYPDLTLRHIGFLGAVPPAVKGLADLSFTEEKGATIEMEFTAGALKSKKGGSDMDPGKELMEKAMAIFRDPPATGPDFQRLKSKISFREAFDLACRENQALANEYLEYIAESRAPKGKSFGVNAGKKLSDLIQKKMEANKGLTYNQAFSEVQMENPGLAGEYLSGGSEEVDLPFMAGQIKIVAAAARDLLAADPNLTKIDAIIKVLKNNPEIVRELTAGRKTFDLSEFAAELAGKI